MRKSTSSSGDSFAPTSSRSGLCEIIGTRGNSIVGRLRGGGRRRAQPSSLAVLLDGEPVGLAEAGPARDGQAVQFRFALPNHRMAATLDISDPLTGRSVLGQHFDLSGHYRLSVKQFTLDGLTVRGRFSVAQDLDEFLYVQLLQDGIPTNAVYAQRDGRNSSAFAYAFEAPLHAMSPPDRAYVLSARIAGAQLPARLRQEVSHKQVGYIGYVEHAVGDTISGWAVDVRHPRRRVALDLIAGDVVVASMPADHFREDVRAVGFGDGKVGFRFVVPHAESKGPAQSYGVVLAGTRTHLINSPVTPRPISRLLGFFDGMQGPIAAGWACDLDAPDTPLIVEIMCEGRVAAADVARHFRGDVEAAGVPIGKCGFRIDLSGQFRAYLGREISARIRGPEIVLAGSPHKVTENPNLRLFLERSARLTEATLARLKRRLNHRTRDHAVSIIMPVHNTPESWLIEALNSVKRQWCDNWELICINDASTEPHVLNILNSYAASDARIRVLSAPENVGIARATNFGIRSARCDYVTFMDHDDYLEPDAVYHLISAVQETGADLLYSDEVLTHADLGSIMEVRARPAFSYDYYLSHPYFVHMICVRTSIAHRIAGWNEAMNISADIDFVLRVLEVANSVAHVPSVIYRWRTHEKSTGHAKQEEVMAATKGAIRRHLERRGVAAEVGDGPWFNQFRIDWPDDEEGRILIVIPTRNKGALLRTCIESIERTAKGVDYQVVVVDHESKEPETREYLRSIARRHAVMPYKGPFNFPRINNLAVRQYGRDAKYILFLNNDIEAMEAGWLQRMRSLAHRPDVGIVGSLLLYGDKRVQHAGVIIGFNKAADHAMKFVDSYIENGTRRNLGYNCTLSSVRDFSAVTAACMMLRKEVFDAVEGFEESFAIGFNDTDLCLRVRDAGLKVLYDGYTMLLHHESATRSETKQVRHPEDDGRLRKRWARYFTEGDPFYNPNLDHDATDHALREDAACKRPAPARLTKIALGAAPEPSRSHRPLTPPSSHKQGEGEKKPSPQRRGKGSSGRELRAIATSRS